MEDYREITLTLTLYKVYTMIIGKRLEREMEKEKMFLRTRQVSEEAWGQ